MKTTAFLFCLVIVTSVYTSHGQKGRESLQNKRITIQLQKRTMGEVFWIIINEYRVPVGLELSDLDSKKEHFLIPVDFFPPQGPLLNIDGETILEGFEAKGKFIASDKPITLNFTNAKLGMVLDSIVKQMGDYKWRIIDGVVNITPGKNRDNILKELLKTRIAKFQIKNGNTIQSVTNRLTKLSEFNERLAKNNAVIQYPRRLQFQWHRDLKLKKLAGDATFSNSSLLKILNWIAKDKQAGWMLRRESVGKDGKIYVELDL